MTGLKQRFFEAIQEKARREEWPWFDEAFDIDKLCRRVHPTEAVLALVKALDESTSAVVALDSTDECEGPLFEVVYPETGRSYKVFANGEINGFDEGGVIFNHAISLMHFMIGTIIKANEEIARLDPGSPVIQDILGAIDAAKKRSGI